ncbi:MAG: ribosome recycling factor [bacterium]
MLNQLYKETKEKMQKALASVQKDFNSVRTGRATPALFEAVKVDYYGTPTPLNQLAKIQIPEARQVVIQPYDSGSLKDIERGIMESNLGLTPNNDGEIIRIQIPDLTEERRKELSSVVKEYSEAGKIALRSIRREARDEIDLLESEGEISEDDAHRARRQVQDYTDRYEEMIEELQEKKIQEIMTV